MKKSFGKVLNVFLSIAVVGWSITLGLGIWVKSADASVAPYVATIDSAIQNNVTAGTNSAPINLNISPVADTDGLDFILSSSDSTSGWYFTDANSSSCTTTLTGNSLHINAGTSNKHFCYFDSTPGVYTLTATNSLSSTASQVITIVASTPPPSDADHDGIPDSTDNCPAVSNSNQADSDSDGVGNSCDNCQNIANSNQADADVDGVGDMCESNNDGGTPPADSDGDTVPNATDNCPNLSNADQADRDSDGIGDGCDNSPDVANPGQEDTDGDHIGNASDNCPNISNADQADADHDGTGDLCDSNNGGGTPPIDTDSDTIPDASDNCPSTPNGPNEVNDNQLDDDNDGLGNACDVYLCVVTNGGIEISDGIDNNCDNNVDEGIIIDTTAPTVTFVSPTPSDGTKTTNNNQTFKVNVDQDTNSCKLYYGVINTATSEVTWGHSYPEDTDGSWYITSPTGTNWSFPDRYPNASEGGNSWVSPVIYDMSSTFHGEQLSGNWILTMNDHVGRDSGAISNIKLILNGINNTWSGSAGIWDYHTTQVTIPVSGSGTGVSSFDMVIGGDETQKTASIIYNNIPDGVNAYYVECTDTSLNVGVSENRILTVDTTAPVITLNGNNPMYLVIGDTFTDPGSTAIDAIDGSIEVSSTGDVDTEKIGVYTITYTATDTTSHTATKTRTVYVNEKSDETDPQIVQINEEVYSIKAITPNIIEILFDEELQNNEIHKPRISDFNVYNQNDESSYEIESVNYDNLKITIKLVDSIKSGDTPRLGIERGFESPSTLIDLSGNYFNNGSEFDAPILDKIIPIISLNGEAIVDITVGDIYEDAGAKCTDVTDEECVIIKTGTVDKNTAGTYTITYTAKDSSENTATVTRTVNVSDTHRSVGSYLPEYARNVFKQTTGQVLGTEKYNFTQLLKFGSLGDEVKELQKFLNNAGYGPLVVDGIFGPKTKAEVIKFQIANGLVGDGIVGPLTRAVLNK